MNKRFVLPFFLLFSCVSQADDFDYFAANRTMIRNGVQAVLMCNGLFTSGRTLEQVFSQELAYLSNPVGTLDGGEYIITGIESCCDRRTGVGSGDACGFS